MNRDVLLRKIRALLHDPPEKALILGRAINGGHEGRARALMEKLGLDAVIPDEVKTADRIASAADRVSLRGFPTDWPQNPLIVHPLSGKQFPIQSLATADHRAVMASVDEMFSELRATYGDDLEKLYLSLWRELLPLLEAKRKQDGMGQLWEVLPADTRVPDHSIWEHRRVTSAIAAALPEPAFLLFALGPVQSFIAAARKTQDLWAGSYLLSFLSWQAMKVVAESWGPDAIIFPDLCGQPFADLWLIEEKGLKFIEKPSEEKLSAPTVPNRFLAILPASEAAGLARQVDERVREVFKIICFAVKKGVEREAGITPDDGWDRIWRRQVENFLEIYWAVLPWGEDHRQFLETFKTWCHPMQEPWEFASIVEQYEKTGYAPNIGTCYSKLYALTERGLGSRKATRDFAGQIEPHFKCTMFAELEPVHLAEHTDFGKLREFWNRRMIPRIPLLRSGERLSAIALTKRLAAAYYFKAPEEDGGLGWDIETSFPSTSTVATSSFKRRIVERLPTGDMKLFGLLNRYTTCVRTLLGDDRAKSAPLPKMAEAAARAHKKIPDLPWDFTRLDGDWLFEESFNKRDLQRELTERWKDNPSGLESARREALGALTELLDFAKRNTLGAPSRYYAVLVMDGDHMGKWVAGEFAPRLQEILHPSVWNELTSNSEWQKLGEMRRPLNPSLHLAISKALRDFSLATARRIVEEEHLGKLIYAGGDDVMAFVSLGDLPEVMRKLRAFFTGALRGDENQVDWIAGSGFARTDTGFQLTMGMTATASMGVAIAHHMQDLGQTLNAARAQEKRAKDVIGRNAFSIALMKRSGGHESFGAKWYYQKDGSAPVDTLQCLIDWRDAFSSGDVSPKFAYVFREGARALSGLSQEAVAKETHRLLGRHLSTRFSKDGKSEIGRRLLDEGLLRLFESGVSLDDLGKFLDLAVFLSREENR
ncbi:MAG TPA: type III-B CRISPR-associated protein Cas10/Cmr2 [Blastocatellia bacterium]|nr:type III-B CRISPR-associated protein Cas10/Cmr2 [Blastocatellia bacterium]